MKQNGAGGAVDRKLSTASSKFYISYSLVPFEVRESLRKPVESGISAGAASKLRESTPRRGLLPQYCNVPVMSMPLRTDPGSLNPDPPNPGQIELLADRPALVARAADWVAEQIAAAVAARGRCSLVLSGGSTPKPLYEALGRRSLPLDQLHLFFGDERYVAPDDPQSNYRMVREAWLDPAQFPPENVHAMVTEAMVTEAMDPAQAAQIYEAELRRVLAPASGDLAPASGELAQPDLPQLDLPQFDIVLLGMGDDGHTASLFPHTPALAVTDAWVTVGDKNGEPRLTLTLPLLNRARSVIFLVSGASKQPALAQVFSPDAQGSDYPARLIQPQGQLLWLMDLDAGKNFR